MVAAAVLQLHYRPACHMSTLLVQVLMGRTGELQGKYTPSLETLLGILLEVGGCKAKVPLSEECCKAQGNVPTQHYPHTLH